jgi:GT2 family glycosyltransferase
MMLQVLVIIVTYNGEKWIEACLNCLSKSAREASVMIIDNASTDNTKKIIKDKFPSFQLIEEEDNLGFGQANNIGMKYAVQNGFDYVFLLNQDAYVSPDTISVLASIHEKHPEFGIISPLQLDGKGKALDELFRRFIVNNYPEDFVQKIESHSGDVPEVFPVRFVNAAAWFISKECLQKVGLFHPLFYHYGEDNNYCSRSQYHGFKAGITPLAAVCHDKIYDHDRHKLLLRQIHLVPLYILLDLRKKRGLTRLLATWKIIGYYWKGIRFHSSDIRRLVFSEFKWILRNRKIISDARAEMKDLYS